MEEKKPGKTPEDWGEIEGVKPPVIRIKKDSVIDAEPHYNREKRLSMSSARKSKPILGFWRTFLGFGRGGGRRNGRFNALLPLLVIAIVAAFIIRYTGRSQGGEGVAGYVVVLRADPFESSLLVSVSFTSTARNAGTPTATVRFLLPDTGEELIVSGDLAGKEPVIRGKMHYTGKEKSIKAEVRIAGQVKTITASIRPPSG